MGPASLTAGQSLVRLPGRMRGGRVDVWREGRDRARQAGAEAKAEALRTTTEEPSICLTRRNPPSRPTNVGSFARNVVVSTSACFTRAANLAAV